MRERCHLLLEGLSLSLYLGGVDYGNGIQYPGAKVTSHLTRIRIGMAGGGGGGVEGKQAAL